jgi:hypothetical protein
MVVVAVVVEMVILLDLILVVKTVQLDQVAVALVIIHQKVQREQVVQQEILVEQVDHILLAAVAAVVLVVLVLMTQALIEKVVPLVLEYDYHLHSAIQSLHHQIHQIHNHIKEVVV